MIADTRSQMTRRNQPGLWRDWALPLSMGLASGALIVAVSHEPAREAELALSAPLCRVLEEERWAIRLSADNTCRITASYRKKNQFWRLDQESRTIQINAAEVLSVRNIRR